MWKTKAAAPHRAAAFCLCGTILNALRVALGIFSGRIILNFGFQKSLRTFLKPIFTKEVVKGNGRCRDTPSVLPLRVKPPSPRGRLNSLSQNLTVLPAPSGREPLARPQTLHFSRKLCRYAKGPILEGAVERSETGGVFTRKSDKKTNISTHLRKQNGKIKKMQNFLKICVDKRGIYGYNNKAPFKCKLNMWRYSSVG